MTRLTTGPGARAAVLLLSLAGLLAACSRSGSDRPVVALVMKSLANEFFKTMEDGARAHQAQHASEYELVATGIKDEQDVARQIAIVEQMIARGVNAIVLAPADSKALVGVVDKALKAGIVVVNIDNRLDRDAMVERGISVPFVGPDNRKGAHAVAAYLARRLHPGDPVAIIEGAPNAFNGEQRRLGFGEALREAELVIVRSQSGYWETARANQVVTALISERPDVKAILCANDSMALGAVAALKAAGRDGQVLVAGFDNISAVHDLVKNGQVLVTADQHGDRLAVYGIEYALAGLKSPGMTRPDRETPVDLVTAETLH
jgi:ribose transport system substrate-binding protein